MSEDFDPESIRRERERRRVEERSRIDRDRRERELELARLRRAELLQAMEGTKSDPPSNDGIRPNSEGPTKTTQGPPGSHAEHLAQGAVRPAARPVDHRPIGRPVDPVAIRQLLAVDPVERFDVQLLNGLVTLAVAEEAASDPRLADSLARRVESLMTRVKAEVDDPLNAGAFLREQVLQWYQHSREVPDWSTQMPDRWSGLFADSRVSGGQLHRWLNARLLSVYDAATRAGRLRSRVRQGFRRPKSVEAAASRSPHQQIQAESAQAILDDLAARPRGGDGPFPLVRLSELAMRRQVPTINEALSRLFGSPETGPFVVLHPNRYPDCDEVQIRPPSAGATGAALAFLLVSPTSARRASVRHRPAEDSASTKEGPTPAEALETPEEVFDAVTVWESSSVTAAAWRQLVDECRRERRRLASPPKDYRVRPSYAALRDLLLEDAEFRKAFLSAKWRGRPAGLPLLVALLQKGSMTPEVGTDHEYLEAELGSLAADDPEWRPTDGTWTFRNWTVRRSDDGPLGRRYAAQPSREPPE